MRLSSYLQDESLFAHGRPKEKCQLKLTDARRNCFSFLEERRRCDGCDLGDFGDDWGNCRADCNGDFKKEKAKKIKQNKENERSRKKQCTTQ